MKSTYENSRGYRVCADTRQSRVGLIFFNERQRQVESHRSRASITSWLVDHVICVAIDLVSHGVDFSDGATLISWRITSAHCLSS